MFLFHRQKKPEAKEPSECQINLFGQCFTIKILNEMEDTMSVPDDLVSEMIKKLFDYSSVIEQSIEEYVKDNYFQIIEEYYLPLSYPSRRTSEYEEHISLVSDYENQLCNHKDILIKNLRPVYYSITSTDSSYLFLYVHDWEGHGVDIDLFPKIVIHKHE